MWQRTLLIATGVLLAGNGLYMLFAPETWYHALESVPHSGPFNPHFVRDIGCAFLAAALGFGCGAWRRDWLVPGMATALMFLGPHAGVHLWEFFQGHASAAHADLTEIAGVYLPPAVALVVLVIALRNAQPPGEVA